MQLRCLQKMRPASTSWSALSLNGLAGSAWLRNQRGACLWTWTSRGMVERARHGQNHCLKLVLDGKQKLLANQYTVVTLSFACHVANPSTSATWAGHGRSSAQKPRGCLHGHAGAVPTIKPYIVHEESADNMVQIFGTATELAEKGCRTESVMPTCAARPAKPCRAEPRACFPRSRQPAS